MKIESIQILNFRGIEHLELEFDPRFTLLVGDNASGKTSILSALSVALGIWHVSKMVNGPNQWRGIMDHEIREVAVYDGGERQFESAGEVAVTAKGSVGARASTAWMRKKRWRGGATIDFDEGAVVEQINRAISARGERSEALPLLAYYGAGRAWLASNRRELPDLAGDLKARQADGYYDCLNERIRLKDILKWFVLQAAARDEQGRFRPGFDAVRLALKRGIPGVDDIYWDAGKQEVIVSIGGVLQPFSNLSDGQRTMASTLADMAIRAVALNSHLLGDGNGGSDPAAVLDRTPGVALIDELDVHLHPSWQRTVIRDLTEAFPKVQFVCSSHSPQVLGELPARQAWILGAGPPRHPTVSYADTNWLLEHHMGKPAAARNPEVQALLTNADENIEDGDLDRARQRLAAARERMDGADGELTRLQSSLETAEALGREDD